MTKAAQPKPTAVILPYRKPVTRPMPGEPLGRVLVFTGVTRARPANPSAMSETSR